MVRVEPGSNRNEYQEYCLG